MKYFLSALFGISFLCTDAQITISRSYPVKPGQSIELRFDYPKRIHVSTWNKNEISIEAKVNINDGENNAAFILLDTSTNEKITVRNKINDVENLPRSYIVYEKGEKKVFHSKSAFINYTADHGAVAHNYSTQTDMEITVDIKVPANTATHINAVYGIVELVAFNGPVSVDATYGGIDASIAPQSVGMLSASTNYGEIYTDLTLNITDKVKRNFHTSFTSQIGQGPAYSLNSPYGNLYLRKSE